jgi:hypothetical protein
MGYVDDFLFAETPEEAEALVPFVLEVISTLGWAINEKSQLIPSPTAEFLGTGINTTLFEYFITPEKLARATELLAKVMPQAIAGIPVTLDDTRSLTGFLSSQTIACPPLSVWTRDLHILTSACAKLGHSLLTINGDGITELTMGKRLLAEHNGAPIIHPVFSERYRLDAGETGLGCHSDSSGLVHSAALPNNLIGASSTLRELFALEDLLTKRGQDLQDRPCFVFDSANAVKILTKGGSGKKVLADATKRIYTLLQTRDISPVYAWVPRERNQRADKLSKRWDQAWIPNRSALSAIKQRWPHVKVTCNRFNTIGWFLRNRQTGQSEHTVLIFPQWPGQAWWPTLLTKATTVINLGAAHQCFEPLWHRDPIGVGKPPWQVHATLLQ